MLFSFVSLENIYYFILFYFLHVCFQAVPELHQLPALNGIMGLLGSEQALFIVSDFYLSVSLILVRMSLDTGVVSNTSILLAKKKSISAYLLLGGNTYLTMFTV